MTKWVLLFMLGLVVLFAVSIQSQAQDSGQVEVGRYQLFQGTYQHWDINQNTGTETHDLFLLDTVTGETQVYMSSVKDGKQTKYWTPAVLDETKNF